MFKLRLLLLIMFTWSTPGVAQVAKLFPRFLRAFKTHPPIEIARILKTMGTSPETYGSVDQVGKYLEKNALIFNRETNTWYKPSPYATPSSHQSQFDRKFDDDAIVFETEQEQEAFKYVSEWKLLEGKSANAQLTSFNQFILNLQKTEKVKAVDIKNTRFTNAVMKEVAFRMMDNYVLKGSRRSDLTYAIMSFQKAYNLPITGILDKNTVAAMDYLTNFQLHIYDTSGPVIRSHWHKDQISGKESTIFEYEWVKRNYFTPIYQTSLGKKEQYIGISASDKLLLKYLGSKGFIPKQDKLCTILAVQTGLFKFQKQQKLPLTGILDEATSWKILEDKSQLPLSKKLPNYTNHVLFASLDEHNDLELIPYLPAHQVSLAKYSGMGFTNAAAADRNVILVNDLDFKNIRAKEEVEVKLNRFMETLPEDISEYPTTAFLITMKISTQQLYVMLYIKDNKMVGYLHSRNGLSLIEQLKYIKNNKFNFVWAGDDSFEGMQKVIDDVGLPTLRRIPEVNSQLNAAAIIGGTGFKAEHALVCNAIPFTSEQLKLGGFSALGLEKWLKFRDQANALITGKFSDQINTAAALRQEIISGEKDILTIIAHSDTRRLYIGNEIIDIDDIKTWENRTTPLAKKRNAVLLICNAGNNQLQKGLIFRKRVASISELLINKGYFNSIIAPDHEINGEESLKILSGIINNEQAIDLRKKFKGWQEYVRKNGEINKQFITSLKINEL